MGHKDFLPIEHDCVTIPPQQVARDKISADLKDGVLTVILPKAEEMKPRKITIS